MAQAINSFDFGNNIYTFTLPYGTCSTAAGTAAKTVDVDNFSLETGARVLVKFTVTNTASSPTLNVEGTGAKAIYYRGSAISAGYLAANRTYEFVYNGTQWDLIGDLDTNTTYTFNGAVSSIKDNNLTASRALVSDSNGKVAASGVTHTELGYLVGVKKNLQSQIDEHTHKYAGSSSVGGAANSAVKLDTAKSINVSDGVVGTAQSFDGTKNISIPITTVYDGTVKWGGVSSSNPTPIDASLCDNLGGNRLAFAKPGGITIEYSTNGGSTWTDYGVNNATKYSLTSCGTDLRVGKATTSSPATANSQLRITFNAASCNIYTVLNKFIIYVSTNGSSGCKCALYTAPVSAPTTYTLHKEMTVDGWSGYNTMNISSITFGSGDTHIANIRFVFSITSQNTKYAGLSVLSIFGYGGYGWTVPSTMARTGHLYSYNENQDATFPAKVTATSFSGSLTGNADTATTASNVAWTGVTGKPSYYDAKAIKGITRSGITFTYTCMDGTTGTFTQQDNNTTYSAATSSALGLVKIGSNITNSSGTISLTKDNVTSALGYTPPTSDTHYTSHLYVGASGGNANATSATNNPYLLCVDNTTNRNSIQLKAGSNMSISAVNGVVTFTATNTDTKNTAGSTNTDSKIFLIGATSQAANPQTYSHDTVYVGTDGKLVSNGYAIGLDATYFRTGRKKTASYTLPKETSKTYYIVLKSKASFEEQKFMFKTVGNNTQYVTLATINARGYMGATIHGQTLRYNGSEIAEIFVYKNTTTTSTHDVVLKLLTNASTTTTLYVDSDGDFTLDETCISNTAPTGTLEASYTPNATDTIFTSGAAYVGSSLIVKNGITGSLDGNASSSTNTYVTINNPSSESTAYVALVTGTSAGNKQINQNNYIRTTFKHGSTSANGYHYLMLGNNTASGTAGNYYGALRLYSNSSGYNDLRCTDCTGSFTNYLPTSSGTLLNTVNYNSYALPRTAGASYPLTGVLYFKTDSWTGDILATNASGQKRWELYSNSSSGAVAATVLRTYSNADGSSYVNYTFGTSGTFETTTIRTTSTNAAKHLEFSRGSINYITAPASGSVAFVMNGKEIGTANSPLVVADGSVYSGMSATLGTSSNKWTNVYATTFTGSLDGNASSASHAVRISMSSKVTNPSGGLYVLSASNVAPGNTADYSIETPNSYSDVNKYGTTLRVKYNNTTAYYTDIWSDTNANALLYKTVSNGSSKGWSRILDSGNYSSYALPISGGTLTGNLTVPNITVTGTASQMPSHYYHKEYDTNGNIYIHYYTDVSTTKPSTVQMRFRNGSGSFKTLQISGGGEMRWDGSISAHTEFISNQWRSTTYGGGWYMSDTNWIRTYGGKSIYQNSGILRTDGTLQVGAGGAYFKSDSTGTNVGGKLLVTYSGVGGVTIQGSETTTGIQITRTDTNHGLRVGMSSSNTQGIWACDYNTSSSTAIIYRKPSDASATTYLPDRIVMSGAYGTGAPPSSGTRVAGMIYFQIVS